MGRPTWGEPVAFGLEGILRKLFAEPGMPLEQKAKFYTRRRLLGESGCIGDGDKDEKENLTEWHFGIGLGAGGKA